MENNKNFGIQSNANEGRNLEVNFNNQTFYRYPVKTSLVIPGDNLEDFIKKFALPYYEENDIFCISAKIVSITKGFYFKEEELKVSRLAKFLVRFVKKWPDDPGFAVPAKIQLAMNIVGMPRFLLAVLIGGFLKLIGIHGWFYRIAGHNINAIDGFIPEIYDERLHGLGFVAPPDSDKIADEIEEKFKMQTALLDGNNVDNNILGMSKALKQRFSKKDFSKIIYGNPQGQQDGTPILIIKNRKI